MAEMKRLENLEIGTSDLEPMTLPQLAALRNELRDEFARLIREREKVTAQIIFYAKSIRRTYAELDEIEGLEN
jgi:hypothetical protein